jgi:TPR repeat protein
VITSVSLQPSTDPDAIIAAILNAGPKIALFPDSFPSQLENAYIAVRFRGDPSALAIIQDAAGKQYHLAEAFLSTLYEKGCKGLAKNTELAQLYASRALPWLRTEAARGNKRAQYQLGLCYTDGKGVEKDETIGAKWHRIAADQGYPRAQCFLGGCCAFTLTLIMSVVLC